MSTATFAPDALLGLEIDEHLDEAPATPCEAVPECPGETVVLSCCPLCSHGYAWCALHYELWLARCRFWDAIFPPGTRHTVVCPTERGGCGGEFPAEDMVFRPL